MKKTFGPRYAVPIGLLGVLILSFGIFIPWLGFYWDDWPVILTGRLLGAPGYWAFYEYDRPISAWTYVLTFPLLGSTPIHWHIFTLLLRWGTAAAFWWTLARLWPAHRREAAWAAFLFSVYPVFTQQPISVAYSQHWTCYLLFFLSLGAMVEAWRSQRSRPGRFWLLTGLAMAASLLQLLTMEYFAGLELLRPFLLWVLIAENVKERRAKAAAVLRGWLPYLLVLAGFTIWRLFFLEFPGEAANSPSLLFRMFSEPAAAGLRFLEIALQDISHLLVGVWANLIAPDKIDLGDRFNLFSWGWAVFTAAAVTLFLARLRTTPAGETEENPRWVRQALVIGTAAVALGMLPVWFTDRQIIVGTYSNRFGLAAMPGASLAIVALTEAVIGKKAQRIILIGLLIGLAAGAHVRTANDYRWSWVRQTRFYWHLYWRAPQIQPGTAIMSDGEIFPFVGLYSTAAGINLVYPPGQPPEQLPYWFYSMGREFKYNMPEFKAGMPLETTFRNFVFKGNTKDSLVIYHDPSKNDCLAVLSPKDFNIPNLPAVTREALSNANLSRILPEPAASDPPVEIFGPEPEHIWCYYYEKASLSHQTGDWETVVELGDQARGLGYAPDVDDSDTAYEWLPFIEAYARSDRWPDAEQLSLAAFEEEPQINGRMCDLWEELANLPQADTGAVQRVRQNVGCP